MTTNHYQCTLCKKPCDTKHLMGNFSAGIATQFVSQCCNAPVVVHSGKDW